MGLDGKSMQTLGFEPKNTNSSLMSAMAAMDPSNQLATLYSYGMTHATLSNIPGMDILLGTKVKMSTSSTPATATATLVNPQKTDVLLTR